MAINGHQIAFYLFDMIYIDDVWAVDAEEVGVG